MSVKNVSLNSPEMSSNIIYSENSNQNDSIKRINEYKKQIDFYCDPSITYNLKRHYTYLISAHDNKYEKLSRLARPTITGIIGGGFLGSQIEKMCLKNEDKKKYFGTGAFIGSFLGLIVGANIYMQETEKESHYNQWIDNNISHLLRTKIKDLYEEDTFISNFICPITFSIMNDVARTPQNIFFDAKVLFSTLNENTGFITDPLRNSPYTPDKVYLDQETTFILYKRIEFLLKTDLKNLSIDNPIRQTILEDLLQTQNHLNAKYDSCRAYIRYMLTSELIEEHQYHEKMKEFREIFGEDYLSPIDWELDWLESLNERYNKNFLAFQKIKK